MTAIVARYAAFAEGEQKAAIVGELVDLLQREVRQPDVVVVINTQPVRHGEQVRPPAPAQRASVAIEDFNRRSRNGRQRKHIRARPLAVRAVKYKNVVVRINRHARDGAEHLSLRQDRPAMDNAIVKARRAFLGRKTGRIRGDACSRGNHQCNPDGMLQHAHAKPRFAFFMWTQHAGHREWARRKNPDNRTLH